ncbi:hypothetical protein NQ317_019779 [Molorchus minor]|uniref:Uncharacterized protein n=1 Tax=Molorchus minor TaxID=1323400 RepID=A0ABQ9K4K7_9CUCU|nr:hypothetical protein NQ317_019779 [Molorchus minor]
MLVAHKSTESGRVSEANFYQLFSHKSHPASRLTLLKLEDLLYCNLDKLKYPIFRQYNYNKLAHHAEASTTRKIPAPTTVRSTTHFSVTPALKKGYLGISFVLTKLVESVEKLIQKKIKNNK